MNIQLSDVGAPCSVSQYPDWYLDSTTDAPAEVEPAVTNEESGKEEDRAKEEPKDQDKEKDGGKKSSK